MAERHIWLLRHAETEWSRDGRHTGATDLPLTEEGRRKSARLRDAVSGHDFAVVLTSPLRRAADTCRLAGLGDRAATRDDLVEWDYGAYEGLTTPQIREQRPGWVVWEHGAPDGETPADVSRRADRIIAELRGAPGDAAVFSHGHLLRALAVRWAGLDVAAGRALALGTGTVSVLGRKREAGVIVRWNDDHHLHDSGRTRP